MSDPYREATRHARRGMSTFAKVFLVGGGLVATLVIAGGIWLAASTRAAMEEWSEYWAGEQMEHARELEVARKEAAEAAAELEEMRTELARRELAAAREAAATVSAADRTDADLATLRGRIDLSQAAAEAAAAREADDARRYAVSVRTMPAPEVQRSIAERQDPVAAELSKAVATVLRSTFDDDAYELTPAESGFGIDITPREGAVTKVGLDFVSVGELLDRVAHGESVLAGVEPGREAQTGQDDDVAVPDWVPVYPGSRSGDRFSATLKDVSVGGAVFVADARGHRILDWYSSTAWRMARGGTEFEARMTRNERDRDQDLRNDLGRYAMLWDGRSVSVFVIEDDHGDSLFVLLFKETAEAEG